MEGFWRPGTEPPGMLDRTDEEQVAVWNPNAALSLSRQRMSLPMYAMRQSVLYCVQKYRVTIVVGATGSGKTTQIPQYLLEEQYHGGRLIGVTQPRRISAMSIANRVAEEMGCALGSRVGYSVRFDECRSAETSILFLTDGLLMRELILDPLLSRYSIIMIDEAHERSIHSDLLFGLLKKILQVRMDLRVIIASATIDAAEFKSYFTFENSDKTLIEPIVLAVSGRQFPVDIHYLKDACNDYVLEMFETIARIHANEPAGDVLCFLTGKDEIDRIVNQINERHSKMVGYDSLDIFAVAIHASMSPESQLAVFEAPPRKTRKIVVATNIAETSVTVPGVKFVIDCGFVKIKWFNPLSGMSSLTIVACSQASANQRAGRAGRIMPGKAYRLFPETSFAKLALKPQPEIQRSDLSPILLQLKILHIENVVHFDFLSPPPAKAMSRALELLFCLGALDSNAKLTFSGSILAELPLVPSLGKMLLAAADFGVSEEMLSIAAMLSVQDVFVNVRNQQRAVDSARRRFAVVEGDHISMLNIFNSFMNSGKSVKWCKSYFLNHKTLSRVVQVRNQLRGFLVRFGVPLKSGDSLEAIQKAVISGLFANAAQLQPDGTYRSVRGGQSLAIHPNSGLFRGTLPEWVVYGEMIYTSKAFINQCTPVSSSEWLAEIAPSFYEVK